MKITIDKTQYNQLRSAGYSKEDILSGRAFKEARSQIQTQTIPTTTPAETKPKSEGLWGFVKDVASDITRPVGTLLEGLINVPISLSKSAEKEKKLKQLTQSGLKGADYVAKAIELGLDKPFEKTKPLFISEETARRAEERPLQEIASQTLSAGSTLAGLGGIAGLGTTKGTQLASRAIDPLLGSLSTTLKEEAPTLESALAGAGTSILAGEALRGAGKIIGKIGKKPVGKIATEVGEEVTQRIGGEIGEEIGADGVTKGVAGLPVIAKTIPDSGLPSDFNLGELENLIKSPTVKQSLTESSGEYLKRFKTKPFGERFAESGLFPELSGTAIKNVSNDKVALNRSQTITLLDNLGLNKTQDNVAILAGDVGKGIGNVVENVSKPINTKDILRNALTETYVDKAINENTIKKLATNLRSLGVNISDNATLKDLWKLKQLAGDAKIKFTDDLGKYNLNMSEYTSILGGIDDKIKAAFQKEFPEKYQSLSKMYNVLKDNQLYNKNIAKQFIGGETVKIKIPFFKDANIYAGDTLSNIREKVFQSIKNNKFPISTSVNKISTQSAKSDTPLLNFLPTVGNRATNKIVNEFTKNLTPQSKESLKEEMNSLATGEYDPNNSDDVLKFLLNKNVPKEEVTPNNYSMEQQVQLMLSLKSMGLNSTEIKMLFDNMGVGKETGKITTNIDPIKANSALSGIKVIKNLKDILRKDPTVMAKSAFLPRIIKGSEANQFEADMANLASLIVKARSGATASDEERARILSTLPTYEVGTDEAIRRLEMYEDELKGSVQGKTPSEIELLLK